LIFGFSGDEVWMSNKQRYRNWLLILLGSLLLLFARRSAQLLHPQVWDEEGTKIIPDLLYHGFLSLVHPINGYLIIVPKVIVGLSLTVSSLFLPLISTVLAWLFIGGVCVAIAVSPTWLKGGVLVCLATLLIPSDPEIFGIALYSFWWASLLLFLVVLWHEESTILWWRVVFVVAGGLSSPVIFLITPFLGMRLLLFKLKRQEALVFGTAVFACIIQAVAMHNAAEPLARSTITLAKLKLAAPQFLGSYLVGNWPHKTDNLLWLAAGMILAFAVATVPFLIERPKYLFLIGLWIGTMLLSAARVDLSIINQQFSGPRYFFFPFALLSWYLVVILMEGGWNGIRWAAGLLLIASIANAVPVLSRSHEDFQWAEHVVSCGWFADYSIPVSFDGRNPWFLDLTHDQCELLQHAGLIDSRWRLNEGKSYPYRIRTMNPGALHEDGFASTGAISTDQWNGSDYGKSSIPGFKVIGSISTAGEDTGILSLTLRRGEKVLFRSGPVVGKQGILIAAGTSFLQRVPPMADWVILEFSNHALPDEFTVSFIDAGDTTGEWSAVALRQ
jgi:hypothetical protein